jgi:hypothetical protein
MSDPLTYYATPGPITHLPDNAITADLLAGLPATIPNLVQAVQNTILHIFWAERYGVDLSEMRKEEVQIRSAAEMLRRIHAVDPAPLTTARPHAQKLVGNCRDFTVLMVALLQRQGIPARARCGFGAYFLPGKYEDHWVAEYWNADQTRWIQVDAQLDAFQQEQLKTDFDPRDVPHDRFLTGGRAWRMVREQGVDAELFGIFDMHGLWFIRGDLVRDFAALNQMPLLPWDCWGIILGEDSDLSEEDWALLDRIAALSLDNAQFDAARALYETDERLRVPPVITSYPAGPEPIKVTLADVIEAHIN